MRNDFLSLFFFCILFYLALINPVILSGAWKPGGLLFYHRLYDTRDSASRLPWLPLLHWFLLYVFYCSQCSSYVWNREINSGSLPSRWTFGIVLNALPWEGFPPCSARQVPKIQGSKSYLKKSLNSSVASSSGSSSRLHQQNVKPIISSVLFFL